MRTNETNKTLKTTSTTEFGSSERPPIQDELPDKVIGDPDGQSVSDRSDSDFDPAELMRLSPFHRRESEAEMLMEEKQSQVQQLPKDRNSPLIGQSNYQSQSAHEEVVAKTNSAGLKTEEARKKMEVEESPSKKISERRVTWNHRRRSSVNTNDITQQDLPVRNQSNGSYLSMPGGDVEKNSTSVKSLPITFASNKHLITTSSYGATAETGEPVHQDSDDDSDLDDNGLLTKSGWFSRKLNSPRFRRKLPNNLQPSIPSDISGTDVKGLELTPNANSNGNQRRGSNSVNGLELISNESSSGNQIRPSNPCIKPQDCHRVLKLGFLKNIHGALWNVPEKRLSPDPQTHSESEQMHDGNGQMKPIKVKTQQSASIPEISSSQSSLPPSHRRSLSPPPGLDPQLRPSSIQDLLQRAEERERERGRGKIEGKKTSPTVSACPSPSVIDGEREAEREESAVASMISAHGWREGNVDESEDEMKER